MVYLHVLTGFGGFWTSFWVVAVSSGWILISVDAGLDGFDRFRTGCASISELGVGVHALRGGAVSFSQLVRVGRFRTLLDAFGCNLGRGGQFWLLRTRASGRF